MPKSRKCVRFSFVVLPMYSTFIPKISNLTNTEIGANSLRQSFTAHLLFFMINTKTCSVCGPCKPLVERSSGISHLQGALKSHFSFSRSFYDGPSAMAASSECHMTIRKLLYDIDFPNKEAACGINHIDTDFTATAIFCFDGFHLNANIHQSERFYQLLYTIPKGAIKYQRQQHVLMNILYVLRI